jgi:hypothetical protein
MLTLCGAGPGAGGATQLQRLPADYKQEKYLCVH